MLQILVNMTKKEHFGEWIIVSALVLIVVYIVAVIAIRIYCQYKFNKNIEAISTERAANNHVYQPDIQTQRIFAVIVSDTCIFGVCFIYQCFCINFPFLGDYSSLLLLVLIAFAVFANGLIVKNLKLNLYDQDVTDELGKTSKNVEATSNIRLVSSFAVLIQIIGFSIFYQTQEYISLIICMTGLVLGRFLYFDTNLRGLKKAIAEFAPYLIYMVLAVLLTIVLVGIGISFEVIELDSLFCSIFLGHIFILMVIKIIKEILEDLNL